MKFIILQTESGLAHRQPLPDSLVVMGLVEGEDFIFTDDDKEALGAISADEQQVFFSSIGSTRATKNCQALKAANPKSLFITYSSHSPSDDLRGIADGWIEREYDTRGHLPLQMFLWNYQQGMPLEELLATVRN